MDHNKIWKLWKEPNGCARDEKYNNWSEKFTTLSSKADLRWQKQELVSLNIEY